MENKRITGRGRRRSRSSFPFRFRLFFLGIFRVVRLFSLLFVFCFVLFFLKFSSVLTQLRARPKASHCPWRFVMKCPDHPPPAPKEKKNLFFHICLRKRERKTEKREREREQIGTKHLAIETMARLGSGGPTAVILEVKKKKDNIIFFFLNEPGNSNSAYHKKIRNFCGWRREINRDPPVNRLDPLNIQSRHGERSVTAPNKNSVTKKRKRKKTEQLGKKTEEWGTLRHLPFRHRCANRSPINYEFHLF